MTYALREAFETASAWLEENHPTLPDGTPLGLSRDADEGTNWFYFGLSPLVLPGFGVAVNKSTGLVYRCGSFEPPVPGMDADEPTVEVTVPD